MYLFINKSYTSFSLHFLNENQIKILHQIDSYLINKISFLRNCY